MEGPGWKGLRLYLKWRWWIGPLLLVTLGILLYWDPFGWTMIHLPWLDALLALLLIGGGMMKLVANVRSRKKGP
ncbi:hypothetical protein SAMN04488025_13823 [Planifilum fulgidum]|uniref:Uncharacterized protein n=1 Tax=Planifilum fulgidum TaxID=201973 RepID=A0A1I2S699_9BACL|nr:hypothetical protein SAMN04488025_13823 [Planifilum fulgidum]